MSETKIEKIVYFIRHGQTIGNVSRVFQHPDSPLNERGKKQAEMIAGRVVNLDFEALITSSFLRARETAEIIEKMTGKKAEVSDLFVEGIKPTSINGKSYDDEKANRVWREWEESLYSEGIRVEDGENFSDLVSRADKALSFLLGRPEKSMVVITHGYFLRTIVARVSLGNHLSGDSFRHFQKAVGMENTGLTILRYHENFEEKPSWHLWIYNDHAHLG